LQHVIRQVSRQEQPGSGTGTQIEHLGRSFDLPSIIALARQHGRGVPRQRCNPAGP